MPAVILTPNRLATRRKSRTPSRPLARVDQLHQPGDQLFGRSGAVAEHAFDQRRPVRRRCDGTRRLRTADRSRNPALPAGSKRIRPWHIAAAFGPDLASRIGQHHLADIVGRAPLERRVAQLGQQPGVVVLVGRPRARRSGPNRCRARRPARRPRCRCLRPAPMLQMPWLSCVAFSVALAANESPVSSTSSTSGKSASVLISSPTPRQQLDQLAHFLAIAGAQHQRAGSHGVAADQKRNARAIQWQRAIRPFVAARAIAGLAERTGRCAGVVVADGAARHFDRHGLDVEGMPPSFFGLPDLRRLAGLDLGLGAERDHDLVDGRIDLDLAVGPRACPPSRSCPRSRCSNCDRETRRPRSPACARPRSAGGRSWRRLPGSSWASRRGRSPPDAFRRG